MPKTVEELWRSGRQFIEIRENVLRVDRQLQTETMFDTVGGMNNEAFKSVMRVERSTANYLINEFAQYKLPKKPKISCEKTIHLYLYYIGQKVTMKRAGILFGVTKATAYKGIRRVISWLLSISPNHIKWPQGEGLKMATDKFYAKEKIPNTLGIISCTYIPLKAPEFGKEGRIDKNYSLAVQNVVDANNMFIDIYMGEPGFLQDTNVLRRSMIFEKAENGLSTLFPESTFLLGDLTYSDVNWIIPPFEDHGFLSSTQENFNKIHLKTRKSGEKNFEKLKKRFQVLSKNTEIKQFEHIISLVGSICVLHNICVMLGDYFENEDEQRNNEIEDNSLTLINFENEEQLNRRDQLFKHLYQSNVI